MPIHFFVEASSCSRNNIFDQDQFEALLNIKHENDLNDSVKQPAFWCHSGAYQNPMNLVVA